MYVFIYVNNSFNKLINLHINKHEKKKYTYCMH